MPVPTHRDDCDTKIFGTSCPDCGQDVYYFSCTCGSKVFFNLQEPPWNPHEDTCIPYLLRYMIEIEHVPGYQVRSIIEEYSRSRGIPILADVVHRLADIEGRTTNRLTIIEVHAQDESRPAMGIIMSVSPHVNFFRRLNYTDNAMGRGLLGKLVRDSYVELVIREDADERNQCNQFCVFYKLTDFRRTGLGQQSRTVASLVPHQIPDGRRIWLVERMERVL